MTEVLELLQTVTDHSLSDIRSVLDVENDSQAFKKESDKLGPVLLSVTENLSHAEKRVKGLLLLEQLMRAGALSSETLMEKLKLWLPLCTTALKAPAHQIQACNTIREVLDACSKIHELDRGAVASFLPELMPSLTQCGPHAHLSSLNCILTLLTRYPKASGIHKNSIERYLVTFLNSQDQRLVVSAAKCAHLLQQVRGGGEQGVNHKTAWRTQLDLLLSSIVNTLELIYPHDRHQSSFDPYEINLADSQPRDIQNVGPLQAALQNFDDVDSKKTKSIPSLKTLHLALGLENKLVFLQAMLIEPFPVSKKIDCRCLLTVLLRCLTMAGGRPSAAVREGSLHAVVMTTLKAVIVCLKRDVLPYTSLILRMVLQTLDWSKTENYSTGVKPYKNVRKTAYTVLCTLWHAVHTLKPPPQQGDISFEDKLIDHLLQDIVPCREALQLTVNSSLAGKGMSKKAKRKMNTAIGLQSLTNRGSQRENIETLNEDLTISALGCLEAFFLASGVFLKASTHKMVGESLMFLLCSVEVGAGVRQALVASCQALVASRSSTHPAPLLHSIQLLSMHQHTDNLQLNWNSRSALQMLLLSLRGAAPPLRMPSAEAATTSQKHTSKALRQLASAARVANGTIEIAGSVDSDSTSEDDNVVMEVDSGSANTKKRKRFIENTAHGLSKLSNSLNCTISSPASKRSKRYDVQEVPEIIDSSDNEITVSKTGEEDLETIIIDETLSNDVTCAGNINKNIEGNGQSTELIRCNELNGLPVNDPEVSSVEDNQKEDENRFYVHKLKLTLNSSESDTGNGIVVNAEKENIIDEITIETPVSSSSIDKKEEYIISTQEIDSNKAENISLVLEEEESGELKLNRNERECNDTVISVEGKGETGEKEKSTSNDNSDISSKPTGISIEEMLGSFVDEVNEDLK